MTQTSPRIRRFFYISGVFNFVAVGLILIMVRVAPQVFGVVPLQGSQLLFVDLFGLLAAGFGLGYVLAGYQPWKYWPFILLGALCKLGVFAIVAAYFSRNDAGVIMLVLASGDGLFAVLFLYLLATSNFTLER